MFFPFLQSIHGKMVKTSNCRSRVLWFDTKLGQMSFGPIYTLLILSFFFSSEISQLEIINQSVLCMFIIIALQLCFVYEPYEGLRNFCVVSV